MSDEMKDVLTALERVDHGRQRARARQRVDQIGSKDLADERALAFDVDRGELVVGSPSENSTG